MFVCPCGATSSEGTRHYAHAPLISTTGGDPIHRQPCRWYHVPWIVQIISYHYIICTHTPSVTALTPFCVICGVVSLFLTAAVVLLVQRQYYSFWMKPRDTVCCSSASPFALHKTLWLCQRCWTGLPLEIPNGHCWTTPDQIKVKGCQTHQCLLRIHQLYPQAPQLIADLTSLHIHSAQALCTSCSRPPPDGYFWTK